MVNLAFGDTVVAFATDDAATDAWVAEFLSPWFTPVEKAPRWRVRLSTSPGRYDEMRRAPAAASPRLCFVVDRHLIHLPAWQSDGGMTVDDSERACAFVVKPFSVDVAAASHTRRWRFTLMRILREIVATRQRARDLDVHAAAVESGGRALVIAGPRLAGKTTLAIHLLRGGGCGLIANDRVFVGNGVSGLVVRGVPSAVKIRADTVGRFPELRRGLPRMARPFLATLAELAHAADENDVEGGELALSSAQIARQLEARLVAAAPLGALLFPVVGGVVDGVGVHRLAPEAAAAMLSANLYGDPSQARPATLFEEIEGGRQAPPSNLAAAIAASAPAYRLALGPNAYERAGAARLLAAVGS